MDYKSNSHKSKAERLKDIKPVISEGASIKKKSKATKFAEAFIKEDLNTVKDRVINDIIIPKAQKMIIDAANTGLNTLFGRTSSSSERSKNGVTKVSYNRYYSDDYDDRPSRRASDYYIGDTFDFDNLQFDSRAKAESVLATMEEMVDNGYVVSIADFYEISNYKPTNQCLNDYGWISMKRVRVVATNKDTWVLTLPKAIPISKL